MLGTGESVVRVTVQKPHVTAGVRGLRPVFAKSPLMEEGCPSEVRTGQPKGCLLCTYPQSPGSGLPVS